MIQRTAPAWFHPGRSGVLSLGPKTRLAAFGELHPRVLQALAVRGPAVAFTLWLEALPFPKARVTARPPLAVSDLQPVERDFAFVLDAEVEAEAVLKAARAADKTLVAAVTVFDVFAGPKAEAQMGPGKKSLAIAVRLQPTERTLTDADIEAVSARVIAGVAKATGGTLRA
jgi:phenylalanyl-tRNA synthetase beta chain